MDDLISYGREPDRDPRPPLARRWRIGAGILLAVAAGLAVTVLAPRHATRTAVTPTPVKPTSSPSVSIKATAPPASGIFFPTVSLPRNNATIVVCAPSTGFCSVRINVRELKSEYRVHS